MRWKKLPKRIWPTILVTYLLVLIIPLIGSVIAYTRYAVILEHEIVASNIQNLSLIREEIDSMISNVQFLVSEIAQNEYVNKYMGFRQLGAEERYVQAKSIADQRVKIEQIPIIMDYYIYYKNSNRVITSTSALEPELFYRYIVSHVGTDYTEWIAGLRDSAVVYQDIRPQTMRVHSRYVQAFTYTQTLPLAERRFPDAVVVVVLDTERIVELLTRSAMGGYACVVNESGELMAAAGDGRFMPAPELLTYGGPQALSIDGEKMVVVAQQSERFRWSFISVIPEKVFLNRINDVRAIIYWTYGISVLAGLLAAGLFAYHSYRPIRNIVRSITGWTDPHAPDMNEYDYITASIINTVKQNRLLEKRILELAGRDTEIVELAGKNSSLMKHSLLARLLDGRYGELEPVLEWLAYYNVRFTEPCFLALLIRIEDSSAFVRAGSTQDKQLLQYALVSISEELANEHCRAAAAILEDDLAVLILNIGQIAKNEVHTLVSPITEVLVSVFDRYFRVAVSIGVGGLQEGIENLPASLRQARDIMEYKQKASIRATLSFDHEYGAVRAVVYPLAFEIKLAGAIKAGDLALCVEILDGVLAERGAQETRNGTVYDIVGIITNVLDAIQVNMKDVFDRDFDIVQHLLGSNNADELRQGILYIFGKVCDYITGNSKTRKPEMREHLLRFIEENLNDANLSQTMIAEALSISSSYLSKLFKKEIGVSMVEYINYTRIGRVKELLRETQDPLEEIARAVGYTSSKTLIRIFKHYEGVTPGRYREQICRR